MKQRYKIYAFRFEHPDDFGCSNNQVLKEVTHNDFARKDKAEVWLREYAKKVSGEFVILEVWISEVKCG